MPPKRATSLLAVVAVGLATLFLLSSSSRQVASNAVGKIEVPEVVHNSLPNLEIPNFKWTFHRSAHRPAEQKNSTSGDTAWHSDWRWLNPFSSSVTLDEDRAVLPQLLNRPPVYTYFDTTVRVEKDEADANAALLTTWKRAWWAHGFRPIVLTQAEALSNPLYQTLHNKGMPKALESEFGRWMAWGHMGSGVLANWSCLPMSGPNDAVLVSLRRGDYDGLTLFNGLGSGLFAGEKSAINRAIEHALDDAKLSTHKDIIAAVGSDRFKKQDVTSIAHYDPPTLSSRFGKVAKMIEADMAKGKISLNGLINAHLHTIWQNAYRDGISVLKPVPAHTTKLREPGLHLAQLLAECPESAIQSSCPPNKPTCSPCVGSRMRIQTVEAFRNVTTLFTIATIPHPYTLITLNELSHDVSVAYIRRNTERDTWIRAVTRKILGDGLGGPSRLIALKDVIASEYSKQRGLWFTVEHFPLDIDTAAEKPKSPTNEAHPEAKKLAPFPEHWLEDLDWCLGFPVPRNVVKHGESYNPIPGQNNDVKGVPEQRKNSYDPPEPSYSEERKELEILRKARQTINNKDKNLRRMRDVAEAWNLADTEVWRFARAYMARNVMERKQWEEEEAKYNGPGPSRGTRWW